MPGRPPIDEGALLRAALAEFTSRSFDEASVNTIIASAGISKGSFYYRFRTKYDLYLHLLKSLVALKWQYIRARQETDAAAGGGAVTKGDAAAGGGAASAGGQRDIFDEFLAQAVIGTEFAREHPEYHRLSVMFSREKGTPVYARAIGDLGGGAAAGLEARIGSAISHGEIRRDLPERLVVRVIAHMLSSFDEIVFGDGEWKLADANEALAHYVEVMRHGARTAALIGRGHGARANPAQVAHAMVCLCARDGR